MNQESMPSRKFMISYLQNLPCSLYLRLCDEIWIPMNFLCTSKVGSKVWTRAASTLYHIYSYKLAKNNLCGCVLYNKVNKYKQL